MHSPLAAAIVDSPYQSQNMLGSRRHSPIYGASSALHSQSAGERVGALDYKHSTNDHSPAFNPAYLGNLISGGPLIGTDYHESPIINLTGGLVAPELWT
jgi:hypothetical protein